MSFVGEREQAGGTSSQNVAGRRGGGALAAAALRLVEASWRPAALLLGICALWALVAWQEWVRPYLVPAPWDVAESLLVSDRQMLLTHTWVTLYETLAGFAIAAVFGMVCALGIVYSRTIERTLYPLLLFAQVIPKVAIAPLFVIWMGFGPGPKILVAVLIAFFPVVISGVAGLRSVAPELLHLSASMGASRWQTFRKIRFPASLPHLFSGLKVAITLAVVGAVVGEFVGANEGLGYLLLVANGSLNSTLLFAVLIAMSLMGIVLFVLVEFAERIAIPWHASRRTDAIATA